MTTKKSSLILKVEKPVLVVVPSQYVKLLGKSHLEVVYARDGNGTRWRLNYTSEPYFCSWCEKERRGTYWIAIPIIACPDHFEEEAA